MSTVRGVLEPDAVVVPAGDALLGEPLRTEHVNVFAISRHPVSVSEYATFLDDTRHAPPANWDTERPNGETPVQGITWADAVTYCRWLTLRHGHTYRLPDEREWEKAARAGVLADLDQRREWTNTWGDKGRVVRGGHDLAARAYASSDVRGLVFRVVRSMTGR